MPTGPKKAKSQLTPGREEELGRVPDKQPRFVAPVPPPRKVLWEGPESTGRNGGITYSMLKRFLDCRERFRVKYVLGLQPTEKFSRVIEYGQMWHVCEEALAAGRDWAADLEGYAGGLFSRYPLQREEIAHWFNVCAVQFPVYVDHWAKHGDVLARTPLFQERSFAVPYKLPSGRVVVLRGKWDAGDLIGELRAAGTGAYVQENKTKGDVDEQALVRQLTFDLQTMIYLVALRESPALRTVAGVEYPVLGVRYNVVRRPLSGGRGTIVRRKGSKNVPAETAEAYYDRLRGIIDGSGDDAPGPSHFFMRWKVEVSDTHVSRFRRQCLDPLLEQLCDWYQMVTTTGDPFSPSNNKDHRLHYRHPFGAGNSIDEYGATDIDNYLDTGSEVGLTRRDRLFEELA